MKINKMPDKETLEKYLDGSHGGVEVMFDIEKGKFIWLSKRRKNERAIGDYYRQK